MHCIGPERRGAAAVSCVVLVDVSAAIRVEELDELGLAELGE